MAYNITGEVNYTTSSAYHYYMGDIISGTVPTIRRPSDNVYVISLSYDYTPGTTDSILIETNGTISSCTIVYGDCSIDMWSGNKEFEVSNYGSSFALNVTISSDSTYINIRPPYGTIIGGSPYSTYFNGIETSSYWFQWNIINAPEIVWSNPGVTVSQVGYQAKVSWNSASVSNGTGSEIIKYNLYCGSNSNGVRWSGTATEAIIDPLSYNTQYGYYVYAYSDSVVGGQWSNTTYATIRKPEITAQPVIQSISPSSGKSTTVSWSAASTIGTNSSTAIYYQYFVGPSSAYSDSYHVGTTTSLSATITQQNILDKCGSSFTGTCYIFVRAYWQEGTTTGGWSVPTASKFTYDPVELSAPGTPAVTQSGQTFKVSWSAASASGGSGNVSYRITYQNSDSTSYYDTTSTSATIAIDVSLLGTQVKFYVTASYSGKSATSGSVYITPQWPSVTAPTNVSIVQSGSKYTISWTASTGSYGSGSIYYRVACFYSDAWHDITSEAITSTQGTFNCPAYGIEMQFRIHATYNAAPVAQSYSDLYAITFADPATLSKPGTPIITQNDTQYIISWSASTGQSGSGSVTYAVAINGSYIYQSGTSTQITVNIQDEWYDTSVQFVVYAYYGNLQQNSDASYFTATLHRTIKYHNGTSFIECIVYCFDNGNWKECIPYYYQDGWTICSH